MAHPEKRLVLVLLFFLHMPLLSGTANAQVPESMSEALVAPVELAFDHRPTTSVPSRSGAPKS